MKIVVACDHAGFPALDVVRATLDDLGLEIVGTFGSRHGESIDFPDVALELAAALVNGDADKGVMVCGTGIGAAIATNRIPGIRAALAHDVYSAHQAVEHDDANVLCLGAQVVGPKVIPDLMRHFFTAKHFSDEQFRRRVSKLDTLAEEFQRRKK